MAWLPVDQSVTTHRKTLAFASELGISPPTAVGHLVFLWLWALDNVPPDGALNGISPQQLASAMMFRTSKKHDANGVFSALVSAGFVEKHGRGRIYYRIHDWPEYGGRMCLARAAHRDRMRRSRARVEERRGEEKRVEKKRVEVPPYSPPKGGQASSSEIRRVCLEAQDDDAVELWQKALATLQGQVTKPNYETWLKTSAGYALNGSKFVVVAPNDFAAEWLSTKLRAVISKTLTGLLGKPTEVEFVLAEDE